MPSYGSPALLLLLRLKLRGLVRRQWRRLRTPKGLLLTVLGLFLFGLWFASLTFSVARAPRPLDPETAALRVRAFGALMLALTVGTALTNRGLYLPRNEIERLFGSPIERADLVRYRLLANGLRNLLGGIVVGLFGARRMPEPALAFLGILLAMQTLPVVNQILAIAFGALEERAAEMLKRGGKLLLACGLLFLGQLSFTYVTGRSFESLPLARQLMDAFSGDGDPLEHPLFTSLTAPLLPWARMITAPSPADFLPWALACLALHAALAELCARVPVDFRELSLQTSARAAARAARMRSGGGVAATRASAGAARWRIPWLFGRGPLGAIAWRKCAGMARKARGALWVALIALAFITFFSCQLVHGQPPEDEALLTSALIVFLGTVYLCSGLRFDFREELERMDVIRAWPLAPAQVFLATLLPEVLLVSLLVAATALLQAAFARAGSLLLLGVIACLPFVVFTWVALDNLVFLFAPVRFVPGQDGFVQSAGRRMIQALLLTLAFLAFAGCGLLGFGAGYWFVVELLGASASAAFAVGFSAFVAILAAGDALLVLLGGVVLRRFDVARDRG